MQVDRSTPAHRLLSLTCALAVLGLMTAGAVASGSDLPPDDEFLEFLGAWDDALTQACDPAGYLPGDDACTETEDDDDN